MSHREDVVGRFLPDIVRNERCDMEYDDRLPKENLGIRCCRRQYKCIIIFMLLIIAFLTSFNEALRKLDDETLGNLQRSVKKAVNGLSQLFLTQEASGGRLNATAQALQILSHFTNESAFNLIEQLPTGTEYEDLL